MEYQFESAGPMLRYVVLVFLLVFVVVLLGMLVLLAALPGVIAKRKKHPQADAINICGWVGLPTGILWCVALVWAYMKPTSQDSGASAKSAADLARKLDSLDASLAILESQQRGGKS